MSKNEEKRVLADISHELKAPIDVILSYGGLIAAESDDPTVREYAEKIEAAASGIMGVIDSLLDKVSEYSGTYDTDNAAVQSAKHFSVSAADDSKTPLVLIVDDDEMIRSTAGLMLGKIFRTETASDGNDAVKKLTELRPALILLDINMPDMDGFETLSVIRRIPELSAVPVIFLTGDEDRDVEVRCLKAGAADFVRKPLVSQVLTERVRRIIELDRLQNLLSSEVAAQTKRAVHLSKEIMLALAKAVDAKDHYTNGHSRRVASYSAEIARRMGKTKREQDDIYAMGLLHDVGKIGVSEAIINKTSRLDDNEYAQIKKHTTIGYDILKLITEIPGLATGARWHHERFDGRGYPDGLSGKNIPEEARIICVADCYDAMTSNRSYSNVREQAAVREEILRCSGTQFDPEIASIMVAMIDDDPEYNMSERAGHNASLPGIPHDVAAAQFIDTDESAPVKKAKALFIPESEGLNINEARKNISDEEILAVTIKRFCELMPVRKEKLRAAFDKADRGGDISAYRIEVHSMKSAAATVGLTVISEVARALEMMAKEGDIVGIRALHTPFVSEWEQTYQKLDAQYKKHCSGQESKGEDGTAMLPELLTLLRVYMEDMDIDAADETMELISEYSYNAAVQALVDTLRTKVTALDGDGANQTADKILREIGK